MVSHNHTLLDVLENNAKQYPDKIALIEADNVPDKAKSITYKTLSERARILSSKIALQSKFGDRVIILMPNSIDYVVAFFACVYAGVIAVTAYQPGKKQRSWQRLNKIVKDCQPELALISPDSIGDIDNWSAKSGFSLNLLAIDSELETTPKVPWKKPNIDVDDIAYLQYSSGTTDSPKGVILTHKNLITNTSLIATQFDISERDIFLNWLPLYHDMGFVGLLLAPMRVAGQIYLVNPKKVAQSPQGLLKLIANVKATVTAGPNFFLDLAVKAVSSSDKETLDLSTLKTFVLGAGLINAHTIKHFNHYFSNTGLCPSAIKPSYGMAENCLLVTATTKPEDLALIEAEPTSFHKGKISVTSGLQANALPLINSGAIIPGISVKICQPQTHDELEDGKIGEILIAGDSLAQGYWQKPNLNSDNLNICVNGQSGFMRTGDLGFIHQNRLYITGRTKEVIPHQNKLYYPQHIEHTVMALSDNFAPFGGAVFNTSNDKQNAEIILVQELSRQGIKADHKKLIVQIRLAVKQIHQIKLAGVVLIKPGSLNKTTSGKIQRYACKQAYLSDSLSSLESWVDTAEVIY
ncbi:fatty acyl-AMP ligase [Catenovulum sp. SM1970]|uniref:fatty acyl-AMP ligase n=1 Tax=Marinifaba aquimaris TaxID=2741323 RepID=UPI00157379A6|nr:fatty acyl-AMP ligase [Marinifaba aquimaris]NTS78839.1 fatty acyl-AMP ligase [Marinifaba aquimaris]